MKTTGLAIFAGWFVGGWGIYLLEPAIFPWYLIIIGFFLMVGGLLEEITEIEE